MTSRIPSKLKAMLAKRCHQYGIPSPASMQLAQQLLDSEDCLSAKNVDQLQALSDGWEEIQSGSTLFIPVQDLPPFTPLKAPPSTLPHADPDETLVGSARVTPDIEQVPFSTKFNAPGDTAKPSDSVCGGDFSVVDIDPFASALDGVPPSPMAPPTLASVSLSCSGLNLTMHALNNETTVVGCNDAARGTSHSWNTQLTDPFLDPPSVPHPSPTAPGANLTSYLTDIQDLTLEQSLSLSSLDGLSSPTPLDSFELTSESHQLQDEGSTNASCDTTFLSSPSLSGPIMQWDIDVRSHPAYLPSSSGTPSPPPRGHRR